MRSFLEAVGHVREYLVLGLRVVWAEQHPTKTGFVLLAHLETSLPRFPYSPLTPGVVNQTAFVCNPRRGAGPLLLRIYATPLDVVLGTMPDRTGREGFYTPSPYKDAIGCIWVSDNSSSRQFVNSVRIPPVRSPCRTGAMPKTS